MLDTRCLPHALPNDRHFSIERMSAYESPTHIQPRKSQAFTCKQVDSGEASGSPSGFVNTLALSRRTQGDLLRLALSPAASKLLGVTYLKITLVCTHHPLITCQVMGKRDSGLEAGDGALQCPDKFAMWATAMLQPSTCARRSWASLLIARGSLLSFIPQVKGEL